ncbi:MAG: [Firmicutes bacterium]|nr:[FeFe] hydrogenase H-cluster radical SAM maturase HydE [Bacillota bacterium]
MENQRLLDKLNAGKYLLTEEWAQLIGTYTEEDREYAAALAREIALAQFGNGIYYRGIIEFSNYCRNDCFYCGIRRGNDRASRYRLTKEDILSCCEQGYPLGFRTFVLQSGEDAYYTDERLVDIISTIARTYPDCAITLSVGERSRDSYQQLFDAGADRYLLRHETADEEHYGKLHPPELSWKNRIRCLYDLKEIGYQTGCGFMVGSPGQTVDCLVKDMQFIKDFEPQMIGIGPFIPHKETPFGDIPAGSSELTLFLLSLCRIMQPAVLLPATTALGSLRGDGRQLGVLAGANVLMPNLSPAAVREKYMLYNNKAITGYDAAESLELLRAHMREIGYELRIDRGDYDKRAGGRGAWGPLYE